MQEQMAGGDIAAARGVPTPYQEETVTERLLLGLARDTRAGAVTTTAYSKPFEGRVGADWLWSFRGAGGGITGLLVQAKILTDPGHHYGVGQAASGGARKRAKNPKLTQAEVLLTHARGLGLPAAYAFYNDARFASGFTQPCPWQKALGSLGGISLVGGHLVGALVSATKATHVPAGAFTPDAWPLSCALLCRDHVAPGESDDLDVQVRAALRARVGMVAANEREPVPDEPISLLQDLHGAIQALRDSGNAASFIESVIDELGIAGMVWVTQESGHVG